jgi:phage gpG-like protein
MGLTGDLKSMGRLQSNLGRLASVPAQIAADASESIAELIQGEFDNGNDPYGRPWAPLAERTLAKGRTPPPLTDTHAMRESVDVRPMAGAGIAITMDDPAGIHQTGARRGAWVMPARPILPAEAFPKTWRQALDDATEANVTRVLGDE